MGVGWQVGGSERWGSAQSSWLTGSHKGKNDATKQEGFSTPTGRSVYIWTETCTQMAGGPQRFPGSLADSVIAALTGAHWILFQQKRVSHEK